MAVFPNIEPSYPLRKRKSTNKKVVKFGDGYEHRVSLGLKHNQSPAVYDLVWENITEDEYDTIDAFLREREIDNASFDFTPAGESFTKTGTYTQSNLVIVISITGHRLIVGEKITIDFQTGNSTDGVYTVSSINNANQFTVTSSTNTTTTGNVSITKTGTSKFVCDEWGKEINYANIATIQASFREVFEP